MKCRRCHGSGVDPEGSWTDEEKTKILKGILATDTTQHEMLVIEEIKELFDREHVSVRRQKVLLAELGAEFPTVRRKVENIHLHVSMTPKGKVTSASKITPGRGP